MVTQRHTLTKKVKELEQELYVAVQQKLLNQS